MPLAFDIPQPFRETEETLAERAARGSLSRPSGPFHAASQQRRCLRGGARAPAGREASGRAPSSRAAADRSVVEGATAPGAAAGPAPGARHVTAAGERRCGARRQTGPFVRGTGLGPRGRAGLGAPIAPVVSKVTATKGVGCLPL